MAGGSSMNKWARLLDVYEAVENDQAWKHLRQPGIRLVMGDSSESAETAKVMVVGEAPGAAENGAGRPFVGASGEILNQLLELAGLSREKVFITNVVKYRPPGNRTPNPYESLNGTEALRAEWTIIKPRLTIAVGSIAHAILHPTMLPISHIPQGQLWEFGHKKDSWITSIFHPAYGLRGGPKVQERIEESWTTLGDMIRECCPEVL